MPDQVIIADTSCLIILKAIDELQLLEVTFGKIIITEEVLKEFGEELPDWIIKKKSPIKVSKALESILDKGEASAIALALDQKETECLLILDDLKARKFAKKSGLNILGTIGVISKAEKEGKIERGMTIIEKIQKTNFRLSDKIVEVVKKQLKQ